MPVPDYALIPTTTMETLQAWITIGRPMGSFCEALVSNNLAEAFARADEENIQAMFHTVAWLYNQAPAGCWGSLRALKQWPEILKSVKSGRQPGETDVNG